MTIQSRSRSREITQRLNARSKAVIHVIDKLECPTCKLPELNPITNLLNFRGLKIMDKSGYWWSHCLACDNWF